MTITPPHQQPDQPNIVDIIHAHAQHAAVNGLSIEESARLFSSTIDPSETEEEAEASVQVAKQSAAQANAFLATMDAVPKEERAAFVDAKLAQFEMAQTDENRAFFMLLFKD